MNIIIKTKNIELTNSLETAINKKIGSLKKFLAEKAAELFVEIERETHHHRKGDVFSCEAIIDLPNKKLTAKFHGDDLMVAIAQVKKQMELELKSIKVNG